MSNSISERQKRRPIILEGIRHGLKHTVIANNIGVTRRVILNDLRFMRYNRDPELEEALKSQEQIRENKRSVANINNDRFLDMTGISFQEKSFQNMIDFNKHELMKILKSKNQHNAIMNLPKSIRKSLKNNGIITDGWHKSKITPKTLDYLRIQIDD